MKTSSPPDVVLERLRKGYLGVGASPGRVLLAVSGGADSTALLVGTFRLARSLGLAAEVACVNHGLRAEAESEQALVERLASSCGLPFHALAATVARGPGVEARAREARYHALEALRAQRGLAWIATGHTASDQAETLLMRLARGSSLAGARGIHRVRAPIVRPLLEATRDEVLAFLQREGFSFATDPMNSDRSFLRVRIRGEVLPALTSATDRSAVRHLARFAHDAVEDEDWLASMAEDALTRLSLVPGGLDRAGAAALHPALRRRVLARWLGDQGIEVDAGALDLAVEACRSGRSSDVGRRRVLRSQGGVLRLFDAGPQPTDVVRPIALEPGVPVEHRASGQLVSLDQSPLPRASHVLPLGPFEGPLELRSRRAGDRLRVGQRRRKLQDALTDLKVPREERDRLAVVAQVGGDVLWVVGLVPSTPPPALPGWCLSCRAL